jgi:hypothetical protein
MILSRLLCVYIGWTITYRYAIAGVVFDEEGNVVRQSNAPAANATLFFILAYSPCYNIGYNALTYSKWPCLALLKTFHLTLPSVPDRAVAIRASISWYHILPAVWP